MKGNRSFEVAEVSWEYAWRDLVCIRTTVFVQEQGVDPEIEVDGKDPDCRHVWASLLGQWGIGTARMEPDGHIGRVAVVAFWRRKGVGRALMEELANMARDAGLSRVYLNAQVGALEFYLVLGYREEGEEFLEAGIPHRRMSLEL